MKKFTLFLSAMLMSLMSMAAPLGEGYSKVTDITTLAAGDKVVLYCDDAELGVTGYDGKKDATVAETGWVEYVVEAAEGGVLLKDGEQYIAQPSGNHFKYADKGGVCTVSKDGKFTSNNRILYQQNTYYRMYEGKESDAAYKPFYVYEVTGEGGGETPDDGGEDTPDEPENPDTPDTPDTPEEPENPDTPATGTTIEIPAEAAAWNIPAEAIDVLQARELCAAMEPGETTGTKYYVMGYVKRLSSKHAEAVSQYKNARFYMENVKNANSDEEFVAFQVKGINGSDITNPDVVAVGDFVVVYGELTHYKYDENSESDYETVGGGKAYIWNSTNPLLAGGDTPDDGGEDTPDEPETPDTPDTPDTPEGAVVFDADVDKGNATETEAAYEVSKSGVTMAVSSGRLGTYNNEVHYRIYKNQTLTLTSTVGNITKVEFTCTANNDEKYGPGCFTVDGGSYEYADAVGTWTGDASSVTFTASSNQVRATQVAVTVNGEVGPDTPDNPDNPATGTAITGLKEADAVYVADAEYGDYWAFDLFAGYDYDAEDYVYPELYVMVNEAYGKTTLNGTYNILYSEYFPNASSEGIYSDEYAEDFVGTLTVKNTDNNGNYSFKGSFVAADGTTYTLDQVVKVTAYEYIYDESTEEGEYKELTLSETDTPDNPDTPDTPDNPDTPDTPEGVIVFDADVDQGNAGTDSNNAAEYVVTKDGVTMTVSSGILGTYQEQMHYRIYKGQTLTLTSTAGNIVSVEFTCTANNDEKYGPGCFTVDGGSYEYADAVGTWTGDATTITFTATTAQVRATQVVVKLATTDVENVLVGATPVKVIENGQVLIIRGENIYNILGAQVK